MAAHIGFDRMSRYALKCSDDFTVPERETTLLNRTLLAGRPNSFGCLINSAQTQGLPRHPGRHFSCSNAPASARASRFSASRCQSAIEPGPVWLETPRNGRMRHWLKHPAKSAMHAWLHLNHANVLLMSPTPAAWIGA